MTVEIVPASEAPPPPPAPQQQASAETPPVESGIDGTTLESKSSGSEVSSSAEKGSATAAPPRPKAKVPSLQEAQSRAKTQRNGKAAEKSPAASPPEPETQPQASEPLLPPNAPIEEPQPHPKEASNEVDGNELFAMPLALPGGRLGGGFDAPSSNPAMLAHDDLAAFKARVSMCAPLRHGVDPDAVIAVRISFKPDGTLASPPKLLGAALSADTVALLNSLVSALEKCQPFAELPADKYRKWKTLEFLWQPMIVSRD
jgi:hypothetical protein